jgi:hypothetical protein
MKKIFVMAVAALMVTQRVSAQHEEGDFTIQPRVGITMSNMTNTNGAKTKLNVTYGVEFEHFFTDEFSVAAGVLFTDQGAKLDDDVTTNIYYGHLPITLNYYVLPGLALKAGIQPGYRTKAKAKMDGGTKDLDDLYKDASLLTDEEIKISKIDLSIPVGISYEYKNVVLDARYNFGLNKVVNQGDAFYNRWFMISLGYKFNVGL